MFYINVYYIKSVTLLSNWQPQHNASKFAFISLIKCICYLGMDSLQVIFDNYKYCDFEVLRPDYLRKVLAKLNVDRFQLGQTNDAVECYVSSIISKQN